ncbi:membrane associated ring finger 1,8 [Olea europaea subsp. europaea]|uniref:Membrane associated ring finger 1,8 n=1 Tax=Olea europaea subsp. europaea TaxID=158383 RepID=A0A8S0S7Y5_OLEEU|nr:membrane associated ring finger 1,8 [Olea europaea subsp. europaea]
MGEPSVDHMPASLQSLQRGEASGECSHPQTVAPFISVIDIQDDEQQLVAGEEDCLIQVMECRICQEEDNVKNLEIPCACSGSLKYAHRKCVQRWCNEKGDVTCEICQQRYQPGYTAPPPIQPDDTTIEISGGWTIASSPLDMRDPRLLAMAAAERHLLEADYDEYADSNASGAAFCRSAALILMALLLLRHALTLGNGGSADDDVSTFFSLFLLRAAGFLLPCYIMAWAISMLQRRRQRQEAEALAASEVAFRLQAGQGNMGVCGSQ